MNAYAQERTHKENSVNRSGFGHVHESTSMRGNNNYADPLSATKL
jgi:hypothetical protein